MVKEDLAIHKLTKRQKSTDGGRYRIQSSNSVHGIPDRDSLVVLRDSLAALVDRFEGNLIAHLRRTLVRRASRKLECSSCSKYDRGDVPRPQAPIDPDHRVAAPDENDIDRETHEEHVHPHERREAPVIE